METLVIWAEYWKHALDKLDTPEFWDTTRLHKAPVLRAMDETTLSEFQF
jgi:hypothetical protein